MNNLTTKVRLKKQPRWKLEDERKILEARQKFLHAKGDMLFSNWESLNRDFRTAVQSMDDVTIAYTQAEMDENERVRREIREEYDKNLERIGEISKILETDARRNYGAVQAAGTALSVIGGLFISGLTLKKSFDSDINGTMVNRKTFDFFRQLNPTSWFKKH